MKPLGALVLFIALFMPLMATKGNLMDYITKSSEVLRCDTICYSKFEKCADICSRSETFVPAIPNDDGSCPSDPENINLSSPLHLEQICDLGFLNPIDANGNGLEKVRNYNFFAQFVR